MVDVGGFDGVDLVLQHGDLRRRLLEGVLVGFFALHCCSRSCFDRCDETLATGSPLNRLVIQQIFLSSLQLF